MGLYIKPEIYKKGRFMFRKILIAAFLFISLTAFSGETMQIDFFQGSLKKACKLAKQINKPLFVFVGSQHCDICRHTKESFSYQYVADYYNEHFVNYIMDPDVLANNIRLGNWGIESIPTLVFMDSHKHIFYKVKGYQDPANMLKAANDALIIYNAQLEKKKKKEVKVEKPAESSK